MNEETAGVLTKDVIFSGGAVLLQVVCTACLH